MAQRTLVAVNDSQAHRRFQDAYITNSLSRSERLFGHHIQRHNKMLYDAVAENLKNGRVLMCPLGTKRHDRPWGISFLFEKEQVAAIFPQPQHKVSAGEEPRILFCTKNRISSQHVLRAAHHFDELFVAEYQRFFSHAIKHARHAE